MARTTASFSAPTVRTMTTSVVRWWFTEVVREEVANDNCGVAEWCHRWSTIADGWRDRPGFSEHARAVRQQVASVRFTNRPTGVTCQ